MKSRYAQIISAALFSLVSLASYGMFYTHIVEMSAASAVLQSKIASKSKSADHMAEARIALTEIVDTEALVQSYFVHETGIVTFIDELQSRGKKLGTVVEVLSVESAGTKTSPIFSLSITARGNFDSVMRTTGSIENAPYHLTITSWSLVKNDKNLWQADFKLIVNSTGTTITTKTKSPTLRAVPANPLYADA